MGINEGFSYVKADWKKLLYSYLILVPVIGLFIFSGYFLKTLKSILKGDKSLPNFDLSQDLREGFCFFFKVLGFFVVLGVIYFILGLVSNTIGIGFLLSELFNIIVSILLPLVFLNFAKNGKFRNLFEYDLALKSVFSDFSRFVITFLKSFLVCLIGGVISMIILLIIVFVGVTVFFSQLPTEGAGNLANDVILSGEIDILVSLIVNIIPLVLISFAILIPLQFAVSTISFKIYAEFFKNSFKEN